MKKLIIMAIAIVLLASCGSLNPPTERAGYDFYNDSYDYDQIYMLYLNNPTWFHENYYLDVNGNARYYNRHPYYIRFQREYDRRTRYNRYDRYDREHRLPYIDQNRRYYNSNTKRNNQSTNVRRVVTSNNDKPIIKRNDSQAVKQRTAIRRTSTTREN
jgi:hypothetical protein